MTIVEAIILGLIQGLTEFLPVSSSGHLEIGQALFGLKGEGNLTFSVAVHGATVLSTIIVFWKEIVELFKGVFSFRWNEPTQYVAKILFSAIPVAIVGFLFEEKIEALFSGNILFVGIMLLVTASLLAIAFFMRKGKRKISFPDALVIGLAQMIAVIPGISRSGATIATGMIIGNEKSQLAKFSFLMVIIPILGANLIKLLGGDFTNEPDVNSMAILAGFLAAFVSGLLACSWMVRIVRKGKIIYFAVYCLIIGLIAIFAG
jgi:undecaprenyl-diphosphatase